MPEFILNRNLTHSSTMGHVINFVKGKPVYVPPVIMREVAALGAECVDGKVDPLEPEEIKEEVELLPDERTAALFSAFKTLEARNARDDFTGQGRPNVKALKPLVGFDLDNRERDNAWEQYVANKAVA
jgi:hypothetical protein